MTKADLKTGMVVENKEGNFYLVIGDRLMRDGSHYGISGLQDDLTCESFDDLTIVAVYETFGCTFSSIFNESNLKAIWRRNIYYKDIKRRQNLIRIADHYGNDAQVDMCIEEMAELIKALNKFRRTDGSKESRENVIEEVADVEIMLEQIEYLLSLNRMEIDKVKDYKISRALNIVNSRRVTIEED